jgi:alkaline phosphatase D
MTGATNSATVVPNGYNAGTVQITGLAPNTRYWYRGRDGGVTDTAITGQFITDPAPAGTPTSFTVGMSGDAGLTPQFWGSSGGAPQRLSRHPIFTHLRTKALAENWRRFLHLGDATYYDLGSGAHSLSATAALSQYRSMWDDLFAQTVQAQLYRDVPIVYVWDDHDIGPNNATSASPGNANAQTAYRERWPSYTLPAGTGANPIYHSFQIGRVLFAVLDTRSARVTGSTILGAAQKTWLTNLLTTTTAEALVLLSPTPWIGATGGDTWSGFGADQTYMGDLLTNNNWIHRMWWVTADMHGNGLASGATNPLAGFPMFIVGGLDADFNSGTRSEFDLYYHGGRAQYGTLRVDDHGGPIALTATVWQHTRAKAWHQLTITP